MGTLNLSEKDKPGIDFDAHYGEVYGVDDARYVQGKNYYGHRGQFVREAPKEAWLARLTRDQEDARRRQMQANRKFFASAKPRVNDTGMPDSVMHAQRENSQAHSAERSAE